MAAYNNNRSSSALFLTALVLFAAANPSAHGQLIPPLAGPVRITGRVCCTSTGNCPGQGVGGALVRLNCTNILEMNTTVAQTNTSSDGSFLISLPRTTGYIPSLPELLCTLGIQLPFDPAVCQVLSNTTGFLSATIVAVRAVVNRTLGLAENVATISPFAFTIDI